MIRLSWLVDHRLLYLFALADSRGRRTADMSRAEENIHLWKMVADENRCFDRPYAFANSHAVLFYRERLSSLYYAARGLPLYRHGPGGFTGFGKRPLAGPTPARPAGGVAGRPACRPRRGGHRNQGAVIQVARGCREHLRAKETSPSAPPIRYFRRGDDGSIFSPTTATRGIGISGAAAGNNSRPE